MTARLKALCLMYNGSDKAVRRIIIEGNRGMYFSSLAEGMGMNWPVSPERIAKWKRDRKN